MTDRDILIDALTKHPDCSHGEIYNGMNAVLQLTRVVKLWRTEECYLADDPPRYIVEGYPGYQHADHSGMEDPKSANGTGAGQKITPEAKENLPLLDAAEGNGK